MKNDALIASRLHDNPSSHIQAPTKSKHTAGPWKAVRNEIQKVNGDHELRIAIGRAFKGQSYKHRITDEEMRANAKLMACAPNMLDVLEQIDDYFETQREKFGYQNNSENRLHMLIIQTIIRAIQ